MGFCLFVCLFFFVNKAKSSLSATKGMSQGNLIIFFGDSFICDLWVDITSICTISSLHTTANLYYMKSALCMFDDCLCPVLQSFCIESLLSLLSTLLSLQCYEKNKE